MPEKGAIFSKSEKLLTCSELLTIADVLISEGIDKVRITGGEPFVRNDIMDLLRHLAGKRELKQISITTNGTLIGPHIEELKELGILNINLSMDAVHESVFNAITRRNCFATVYSNLMKLIELGFNIKINCVVLNGQNTDQILPLLMLAKENKISVRFLEEMPFNGGSRVFERIKWDYKEILSFIAEHHPNYYSLVSSESSTSLNFKIPGYAGSFGVIPSFSRTFCGSCNRIRVTATGDVITCLYAEAYLNIRDAVRVKKSSEELGLLIREAVTHKAKDGFSAQLSHIERGSQWESMTSIGG
ncbi:molybdenum cofactor biosynthesis protein A [Flavobacterium sp. F52]|nr:molybdenum cofactor biosynthesis protein A [Flavobacterium sp. F52]